MKVDLEEEDVQHLRWIWERLQYKHGEDPRVDYMRKLEGTVQKLENALQGILRTPPIRIVHSVRLARPLLRNVPAADDEPRVEDRIVEIAIAADGSRYGYVERTTRSRRSAWPGPTEHRGWLRLSEEITELLDEPFERSKWWAS